MKKLLPVFFLFLLFCETTKSPFQPDEFVISFNHPIDSMYVVKSEDVLLRSAYTSQSQHQLNSFCDAWNKVYAQEANQPNYNSDWDKEIYQLFYDFYKPSREYLESEYLVLQNEIVYIVVDSSRYGVGAASEYSALDFNEIAPFWPQVRDTGQNVLYLTDRYKEVLNFYISEYSGLESFYNSEWQSWEYVWDKVGFLESKFALYHNHWVPSFHYYSFPHVSMVIMNEDEPKAILFYRDSWSTGGTAEYEKTGTEWKYTRTFYGWME